VVAVAEEEAVVAKSAAAPTAPLLIRPVLSLEDKGKTWKCQQHNDRPMITAN